MYTFTGKRITSCCKLKRRYSISSNIQTVYKQTGFLFESGKPGNKPLSGGYTETGMKYAILDRLQITL